MPAASDAPKGVNVGDIGYIEGDVNRPAIVTGIDRDDDGNEFVTYEALGAGVRAPQGTIVSHADVKAAQDAAAAGAPETSGNGAA